MPSHKRHNFSHKCHHFDGKFIIYQLVTFGETYKHLYKQKTQRHSVVFIYNFYLS